MPSTPQFLKAITAPRQWAPDAHPWYQEFGIGGIGHCDCCGAGLKRRVVVDTDGKHWGSDCFATATGTTYRAKRVKNEAPSVSLAGQSRITICTMDGVREFFATDGVVPAALLNLLDAKDYARAKRWMCAVTGEECGPLESYARPEEAEKLGALMRRNRARQARRDAKTKSQIAWRQSLENS